MSIGTSRAEPWRRPRSTRTNVKRARLGRFTRLTGLVIALAVLLSTPWLLLLSAPGQGMGTVVRRWEPGLWAAHQRCAEQPLPLRHVDGSHVSGHGWADEIGRR